MPILNNIEWEKKYKEHFEKQDAEEIVVNQDKDVQDAADERMARGDEEMNDVEKELLMKKTKYDCLVRQFWAPERRAEWLARMEKAGSIPGSAQDNRAASAISSVKESIGDKEEIPKYSPLVPEMWKERMLEFSNLHVVKFLRIFQSAMYLLKFKTREEVCERGTNLLIWKKIKPYFQIENDDSFYKAISTYQPFG